MTAGAVISEKTREYSRHLLRALLREASYLPDNVARIHFRHYVLARFRTYASDGRDASSVLIERIPQLHAQARKSLHFLQRANVGFHSNLSKVLFLAYGRIGKRKHLLLEPLKRKDESRGSLTLFPGLEKRPNIKPELLQQLPYPNAMLEAILRSQVKQEFPDWEKKDLKRVSLTVPATNAWHRPMPVKRVGNIVRDWYANVLDKVLAPLPDIEWFHLQKLALGETRWPGPVPRRTHRGVSLSWKQLEADIDLELVQAKGGKEKPHNLTAAYMRRRYEVLFRLCPRMEWNSRTQRWLVHWGDMQTRMVETRRANAQLLKAVDMSASKE